MGSISNILITLAIVGLVAIWVGCKQASNTNDKPANFGY